MGKLMVVVARLLSLCAVLLVLPGVAALAPMTAEAVTLTKFDKGVSLSWGRALCLGRSYRIVG